MTLKLFGRNTGRFCESDDSKDAKELRRGTAMYKNKGKACNLFLYRNGEMILCGHETTKEEDLCVVPVSLILRRSCYGEIFCRKLNRIAYCAQIDGKLD